MSDLRDVAPSLKEGKAQTVKKGTLLYIEWYDAESNDDWRDISDIVAELPLIQTIGFLIKESKDCVAIAQNIDKKNDNASMSMIIPKAWVKRIRKLSV